MNANFYGPFLNGNLDRMLDLPGVYLIYRNKFNPTTKKSDVELIYVGQSMHVKTRIEEHNRNGDFSNMLSPSDYLSYAYALVLPAACRDVLENALVYSQQPIGNTLLKDSYQYNEKELLVSGHCPSLTYGKFGNITIKHPNFVSIN